MMGKREVQAISKKLDISEKKVEKMLKETFDAISEPPLDNIDCPHHEIGIGPSDKD